jgi:hypothetical protein
MVSKAHTLRTYGTFHTGTRSDSVGMHKRYYAAVYRHGHPIMFSGKTREVAINRLYADIRDLMYEDVVRLKKGLRPMI